MAYIEGRVVHDADAHIMEWPTWLADYADPATPYMYHCHVLYHEDQGMMGQFVIVNPGHGPAAVHQDPTGGLADG